jgi:hypothetical protein
MLLSVSDLLRQGFELYKKHSRLFLTYAVLINVPFIFFAFIYSFISPPPIEPVTTIAAKDIAILLVTVLMTVWSIWVSIAFIRVIWATLKGQAIKPVKAELTDARGLILPTIGAGIIAGLITFGGIILLIIPGIIFALWFTFITQEVAIEKQKATAALRESKRLVQGRWSAIFWRVIAISFFFFVIAAIPQGLMQFIFETIMNIAGIGAQEMLGKILMLVSDLIAVAITIALTPFATGSQVVFYDDAKRTAPAKLNPVV